MLPSYEDITSRITDPPLWYDGRGVPRYDEFTPRMLGIYDALALLVEVECSGCGQTFLVADGWTRHDFRELLAGNVPSQRTLTELVEGFVYGDPPRHGQCAGNTMTCDEVRVVQAWEQADLEWERVPALEITYADLIDGRVATPAPTLQVVKS